MYFNLEKETGKKIDVNPKHIISRSLTPLKLAMNKDMKMNERLAEEGETPDKWQASLFTSNPNLVFSFKFDKYEDAEEFLKRFKEDL